MKQGIKVAFWLKCLAAIVVVVFFVALVVLLPLKPTLNARSKLGFTFSIRAAEALGLDWKQAFDAALQDLHPAIVRIPIDWDRLEAEEGVFDFTAFDYQVQEIEDMGAQVILVVGVKLPRWPECHIPAWAASLPPAEAQEASLIATRAVVNHFSGHDSVYAWQVENEALFSFGECPAWVSSRARLKKELNLVRSLAGKALITTSDSGELSTWLRTATLPIDALSISLYRAVYDEKRGYFYWPVNPYFYRLHALLMKPFVDQLFISELQMEPWGPATVQDLSTPEMYRSFSPLDFSQRIDFAQRTGAEVILAWGVEWWYYMKEIRHDASYWEEALKVYGYSY